MKTRFTLSIGGRVLHIDIETLCAVNLKDVGAYRYARDPSFRIILISYAWDNADVITLDCYYEAWPGEVLYTNAPDVWDAIFNCGHDGLELWAHNAAFEMICFRTYYDRPIEVSHWWCTSVASAYLGLPMALDKVAQVLQLPEQKSARGKVLIKLFSAPQAKPAKKYNYAVWVTPEMAPAEWLEYKQYNAQDVYTEREVHKYCARFPMLPQIEHDYYEQNEGVNENGVYIDVEFVEAAVGICQRYVDAIFAEMLELSNGEIINPNSDDQIKAWINAQGVYMPYLNKDYLKDHVDLDALPPHVSRMIELRRLTSMSSLAKFDKMLVMLCEDFRVRGIHQFYGASTGRFAGRGLQGQNMKKTFSNSELIEANAKRLGATYEAVERLIGNAIVTAKEAIRQGLGELLYEDITDVVSKLVRPAIIAAPGKSLVPCDFKSIEARMLAYVAGEDWVLDIFRGHGKIYEATASRMYNVLIEDVTKDMRARGKIATLALGYQGAVGALVTSGALRAGMLEEELPGTVAAYRAANPRTVKFWKDVEKAARYVIKNKSAYVHRTKYCALKFTYERGYMFITLPSGRRLAYHGAHIAADGYRIRYWGLKQMKDSTAKAWTMIDLYGGLITENIIQAMARDCLVECMYRMKDNIMIVMHIHDEVVAEADDDLAPDVLRYMEDEMSLSPLWASDLPLGGEGYVSKFYRKD